MQFKSTLSCAWLLLGAASAGAATLSQADLDAIQALEQKIAPLPGPQAKKGVARLADRMAEAKVPSVSIAFIEDGQVKWSRAYGEKRAGSGQRTDPATLFQAASLSKAVTAAAALRLVDAGRLSLDEDVQGRLGAWRLPAADGSNITLRQLLSHTAGLSVAGYPGYRPGDRVPTLVESLSGAEPANTAPVRMFAAPGTQMAYSGGGYSVAQLLMSEGGKRDFSQVMQRHLLRPAGMARSSFRQPLPPEASSGAAMGHDAEGQPVPGGSHVYPELAAAGLWTTPTDYARFLIALQDSWSGKRGALLRPKTARAMMTPVMAGYGLGVVSANAEGRWFITHLGSNEGFQSRFAAFLDGSRQGVVIMANGEGGGRLAAAIQFTLARAYKWPEAQIRPTPRAPDS